MITPSPTTPIASHLTRGVFEAHDAATATRPESITLYIPDTSYRLTLAPTAPIATPVGKKTVGEIKITARKITKSGTGGRFVAPVRGYPQRVQGTVVATDERANTVTVRCGVPICLQIAHPHNHASHYQEGELIACDVMEDATFTPAS